MILILLLQWCKKETPPLVQLPEMTKHPMVKHSVINTTMHKADAFMQQKGHLDLIALESQAKKKKKKAHHA